MCILVPPYSLSLNSQVNQNVLLPTLMHSSTDNTAVNQEKGEFIFLKGTNVTEVCYGELAIAVKTIDMSSVLQAAVIASRVRNVNIYLLICNI